MVMMETAQWIYQMQGGSKLAFSRAFPAALLTALLTEPLVWTEIETRLTCEAQKPACQVLDRWNWQHEV